MFVGMCLPIREWLEPGEKIDLYFDENSVSDSVHEEWAARLESYEDHIRDLIGGEPRFVNDEEFLPLQAADFWAWWVREGYEQGNFSEITQGNFGQWQSKMVHAQKMYVIPMDMNEDQLTATLIDMIKKSTIIPGLTNIYDEKSKPRTERAMDVFSLPKRSQLVSHISMKWRALKKRLSGKLTM